MSIQKLIIAEKADMGRAIADYLWPKKDYVDNKQWVEKDGVAVSWAAGHLYYLAQPADYGFTGWNQYRIYPEKWDKKPYSLKIKQVNALKDLLKQATEVVNAGDPDREGQIIVDEILEKLAYKGTVKRLMLNAKDSTSMKRAFDNIEDNSNYHNLSVSALARTCADWLVGMNLSRCYQKQAEKYGIKQHWRIGRVKMPTLALVVNRERDLKSFTKHYYYELQAVYKKNNTPVKVKLVPAKDLNLDEKGHILEKTVLQAIMTKIKMSDGIVKAYKKSAGADYPPLPYSMDKLQVEANKKYRISPKKVLEIVEELYLAKLVSYPRSDCNYIPKAQLEDAPRIIAALKAYGMNEAGKADLTIVGKAWNDEKITAHHAIIPTGVTPDASKLSDEQKKIYMLIAQRYILQFLRPCKFESAEFTILAGDETLRGSCKHITDFGYKGTGLVDKGTDAEELSDSLPVLQESDNLGVATDCKIDAKETKPPKRFTAGTLISAMTDIWRYMDAKNPNREKLKEIKGLGTSATRDSIIDDLMAETVNGKPVTPMIKLEKNELVPTAFGYYVVDNVAESLMKPDATALMEYKLAEIEAGKYDIDTFLKEIKAMVEENIDYAENHEFPLTKEMGIMECPRCHKGILVEHYSKINQSHFFICNNEECKNPYNNRSYYYDKGADGKPMIEYCPTCKDVMERIKGQYGYFWKCSKCKANYKDKAGKPDFSPKPAKPSTYHKL